jgi:hypothetical protein
VGVAGEGIAESLVSRADGIVQTFNDILVGEAQKESGTAIGRAAMSFERAEKAENETQRLKAENLRLEALIAPRSLSLDQQREIADACRKFHGHGILVESYGTDGEAAALGEQIISTLRSAHVVVADSRGAKIVSGGFDIGLHVRGPAVENEFASVLGNALSRIGKLKVEINDPEPKIGFAARGGGEGFSAGAIFVTVMIGVKPQPVLPAPQ